MKRDIVKLQHKSLGEQGCKVSIDCILDIQKTKVSVINAFSYRLKIVTLLKRVLVREVNLFFLYIK